MEMLIIRIPPDCAACAVRCWKLPQHRMAKTGGSCLLSQLLHISVIPARPTRPAFSVSRASRATEQTEPFGLPTLVIKRVELKLSQALAARKLGRPAARGASCCIALRLLWAVFQAQQDPKARREVASGTPAVTQLALGLVAATVPLVPPRNSPLVAGTRCVG
jgi:hypothetical protein